MKRRSLFAMVPAASALLALRGSAKPVSKEAVTKAGFAISVQCWSFNKYPVWEAVAKAAEAGASAVEFFPGQILGGPYGQTAISHGLDAGIYKALLGHCAKNGIVPVNYGVCEIPKEEDKARPIFEMAKTLGLYGLTTESSEALDTMEKLAVEYDLKICFHNHPVGSKMSNPYRTWDLVKDRHANIGFCCDIGHLATSGLDPLEVIKKIAPRVRSFHFKDRDSIEKESRDRPFGTGVIDLAGILDEVRKHGFAGNVSIEYEYNWEKSVPDIAQCVGYLRGYAASRA